MISQISALPNNMPRIYSQDHDLFTTTGFKISPPVHMNYRLLFCLRNWSLYYHLVFLMKDTNKIDQDKQVRLKFIFLFFSLMICLIYA